MAQNPPFAERMLATERFIRTGDQSSAIAEARKVVRDFPDAVEAKRQLGELLSASGSHNQAIKVLKQAVKQADTSTEKESHAWQARHSLGNALSASGRYHEATRQFLKSIDAGGSSDTLYAAAATAFYLDNKPDQARVWGEKCLQARDQEARQTGLEPVPLKRPTSFDPAKPERNVISYSLFGTDSYYYDCAVTNARMAAAVYPDFHCRFYCGQDVPTALLDTLAGLGARVAIMTSTVSAWDGLFWRFLPFEEPDVDVVLVRDVDTPLMARERVAVEEWLDGEAPFHVMRDHPLHLEPMMAGLWGGFTGLLPSLKASVQSVLQRSRHRYIDQIYLRLNIWPRIRDATLAHDSFYSIADSRKFPPHGRVCNGVHVGWNWRGKTRRGEF